MTTPNLLYLKSKRLLLVSITSCAALLFSQSLYANESNDYVYQQSFMPKQTIEIDLSKTAIFITDPQNDFLSEQSPIWPLVGPEIKKANVIEHEKMLIKTAKEVGIPVFYSPHMYTQNDLENWTSLNGIDQIMFQNKMFVQGTKGHEFLPGLEPDDDTVVLNPHKGLSNFWTGDAAIQLRQRGITTLIMGGMAANMCVESHARDAIENGFDLIIVADATAAAGADAKQAALINFEFLGHEVVNTEQIIKRLKALKNES